MTNRVTLNELAEQFSLSTERLDEPCMDDHLTAIALYLTLWKTFACHLGLTAAEIEAIESDAKSTEEMRQKTLQKWADKFAHRATYRSLISAFLEVNNAKLATRVCQLLAPEQLVVSSATAGPSLEDSVDLGSFHDESSIQNPFSSEDLSSPSSTETTFSQARNTSTSMLPYLETPRLNEAEKSALEGRLVRESCQMLLRFNKLLQSTIKSLKELGVTPEDLITTLMCLQTMLGDQQLPLFHEYAERMAQQGSIDKVFWFLSDHISFINYDVIEHIIQSHGVDENKLEDYKAELKEYCKRRVSEYPQNNCAKPCTPGYTPIVIKLDKHINRCKLLDINRFRDELSRILQVHSHALVFLKVEEGCIQLTFQIPSFIVDLVFPLSREQEASLKTYRVLKLVCGVYTYSYSYSLKRQGSIGNGNEAQDTTMDEGTRILLGQENFPADTNIMEIDARSDLNSSVLGIEESIHPQSATVTECAVGSLDFRSTDTRGLLKKANIGPLDEQRKYRSRKFSEEKTSWRERVRHEKTAKEELSDGKGDRVTAGMRDIGGAFKLKMMEAQEEELDQLRSMKVVQKYLGKRETSVRARRMFNRRVVTHSTLSRHTRVLVTGYKETDGAEVAEQIRQQSEMVIDNFFSIPPRERRDLDQLASTQMRWISDAELGKVHVRQHRQLDSEMINERKGRDNEPTDVCRASEQMEPGLSDVVSNDENKVKRRHHPFKRNDNENEEKPSTEKDREWRRNKGETRRVHYCDVVEEGILKEAAAWSEWTAGKGRRDSSRAPPLLENRHSTSAITEDSHHPWVQMSSALDSASEDSEMGCEPSLMEGKYEDEELATCDRVENNDAVGRKEAEIPVPLTGNGQMTDKVISNELLKFAVERREYEVAPLQTQEQPGKSLIPDRHSPISPINTTPLLRGSTAEDQTDGFFEAVSPKLKIDGSSQAFSSDSNPSTGSSKYKHFFPSPQLSLTPGKNSLQFGSRPDSYESEVNPFSVEFQEALKQNQKQNQERSPNKCETAAVITQHTSTLNSEHKPSQALDLPPQVMDDPGFIIYSAMLDHKPTRSDYIAYKLSVIGDKIDTKYDAQLNQALDALFTEVLNNTITWDSFNRVTRKLLWQSRYIQDGIFMIPCLGRRLLEFVPQLRDTITDYTRRVMDNSWDLILKSGGWDALMEEYPEVSLDYEDWREKGEGLVDAVGATGYDLFSPDFEHTLLRASQTNSTLPASLRNQPYSLDDTFGHLSVVDPHCLFQDPLASERSTSFGRHLRRRANSVEVLLSQTGHGDDTSETDNIHSIPAGFSRLESRRHSSPSIHSNETFLIPGVSSSVPIPSVHTYNPGCQKGLNSMREKTPVKDLHLSQPVSSSEDLQQYGPSQSEDSVKPNCSNRHQSRPSSAHSTGGSRATKRTARSDSTSEYMDLGFNTVDFARQGRPVRSSTDSVFTCDVESGEWKTVTGSPKQRRRRQSSLQVVSEHLATVGPILTHAAIGVFAVLFAGRQ